MYDTTLMGLIKRLSCVFCFLTLWFVFSYGLVYKVTSSQNRMPNVGDWCCGICLGLLPAILFVCALYLLYTMFKWAVTGRWD